MLRLVLWIFAATCALVIVVIVVRKGQLEGEPTTPQQAVAVSPAATQVRSSATVTGFVAILGTAPAEPSNPAAAFSECKVADVGDRHKAYRIRDGKVANAFVYIKEGLAGSYPAPSEPTVLDQQGCAYMPRVLGLQLGQPLMVMNSDSMLHNVHALPKSGAGFNVGMPMKGMKVTRTLDKPEVMVMVKCDIHGWMRAYVGVLPHPFFAVSGADGAFSIPNVPPGTYTLEAWHEKLGTLTQYVSIAGSETKSVIFTYAKI